MPLGRTLIVMAIGIKTTTPSTEGLTRLWAKGPAKLLACLLAHLLACLLDCLLACLLACFLACLLASHKWLVHANCDNKNVPRIIVFLCFRSCCLGGLLGPSWAPWAPRANITPKNMVRWTPLPPPLEPSWGPTLEFFE